MGNANSIAVEGDSTFTPTMNGQYYATVTNKIVTNLVLYTDTTTYTVPSITNKLIITLSPNPAKNAILIDGLDEHSTASISISDMSGIVWMKAVAAKGASYNLDISRLKSGYYLVNVVEGKTTKAVQFIKE